MTDRYKVGSASADFIHLKISNENGESSVEPKVMEVLRVLIENAGEIVSRDDLINSVWGAPYGGEERLSRAISLLRKALGDTDEQYLFEEHQLHFLSTQLCIARELMS